MTKPAPHGVHSLKRFDDAAAAVARIAEIYETGARRVRERFDAFVSGDRTSSSVSPAGPRSTAPRSLKP